MPSIVNNSMHVLLSHVPSFVDKYGPLWRFSQEGTERTVATLKRTETRVTSRNEQMQSGGVEGVMRKESMRVVIDERKLKRKREHNNKPRKKPLTSPAAVRLRVADPGVCGRVAAVQARRAKRSSSAADGHRNKRQG